MLDGFCGWSLSAFSWTPVLLERTTDRQICIHTWVLGRHFLKNGQTKPDASRK